MVFFFQLVGAFVLALIIVLAILFVWVRYKYASFFDDLSNMAEGMEGLEQLAGAMLLPLRIEVEAEDDSDWEDEAAIKSATDELLARGFSVVGDFYIEPVGVPIRGLVHVAESIYAVIYQNPLAGTWYDMVTPYADGTWTSYSTGQDADLLDAPPGKPRKVFVGVSAGELCDRFLRGRPSASRQPVSAQELVPSFEQYYAEEMDWRVAKGGPSNDEIHRAMQKAEMEVDDDMIEQMRSMWQGHVAEHMQTLLREEFRKTSGLSEDEYEEVEDRLLFVYDELPGEILLGYFELHLDYGKVPESEDYFDDLLEEAEDLAASDSPGRAVFEKLVKLAQDDAFEKVATLETPVPTDVYRGPEEAGF